MKPEMKTKKRSRFLLMSGLLLLGLACLGLAGCQRGNPFDGVPRKMEADYGRSVIHNSLDMTVTPPDRVDTRPPVGIPPQAAVNTQEAYDKSFKRKEEPQTLKLILR